MKRPVLVLLIAAVLGGAGYWVYVVTAPPDVRVGWFLDEMVDNFNRSRPGACARGLSDNFRDETAGVGQQHVRAYLTQLYFRARDPKTKEFLYLVKAPAEEREIEVDDDPLTATVRMSARFYVLDRRGDTVSEKLVWDVRIEARLRDGEDGWKVERSTHESQYGGRM